MTAHLIAAPTPTADPRGSWLKLSAALTEAVTDLADREDLTVTCAPGLGRGAPGCFIPALATVELDGTHLGHDPATCDPSRPADRNRYPALWGVLVHEAAHARHSCWATPNGTPAAHVDAAMTLEESRIEAAQIRRRPADRRWLRAAASHLVLADFTTASGGPAPSATAMTPWNAARAAGLLLARTDAGILDHDETAALAATITKILGASRLSALAALWHIAHITADDDHETMLDLGRRWCAIVGTDPDQPAPTPTPGATGESEEPSALAEAITSTVTTVTIAETSRSASPEPNPRQRERDARDAAERAARRVFGATHTDTGRRGPTAIKRTRPPRPDEQAAARRLARRLRAAAHRERTTTTHTSATPPGRLRMREALAADAQRAAGVTPTAEPFIRTVRRHVPTPPLRVGIACDVSGSMNAVATPVASAAWILARAAAHVPDARSATVIYGAKVRPITRPGRTPTRVAEFTATDSTEDFIEAVEALDAALDLSRPGAARLLVVVSDGIYTTHQRTAGQQRINRLTAAGCAVLWLALDKRAHPMKGTQLVTLADPATAADTIGQAAAQALRNA
ncbi:hypothetical protein Arub01_57130 [Actinomadura rubrobrunea]|uniref:VWA domain-containing protein n=1 Tax=Actinomadura rubrobrunea TaxID=115335 RepID=A0A9W6Q056_9ACTN|nr:VWA domain-containing protein [Actinomadura rubrobrunea]GLW67470.1 hypothetical protein Arub01_57130 [Actinomadura rubrobrunea]